jgi:hypothetical protein
VTYGSFVVDIKEHKEENERTILTVGGDQIEYPGEKSTRTAGLNTAKIIINSVISTFGAKFLVIDIKKIYFNTPLGRFEYMVINLSSLPQEKIDKYDLIELAQDGKVYIEIQKGMYGLPQAGTHPETKIWYHASDMILYIHSDASYLLDREAKSRAGGFFYMGSSADTTNKLTKGAILIISTVLKHVMSSAAEAEKAQSFAQHWNN